MRNALTVTVKAADPSVLTVAEMRAAAGLDADDASQDAVLAVRGSTVAAGIMTDCNVAVGAGAEPTLMQETLTERIYDFEGTALCLARRHNVQITSLTVDDEAWSDSNYVLNGEAGTISLPSDRRWCAREIVAVYKAGFETVPPELKQEALDRFSSITLEADRDPYVKGTTIETVGVETVRTDYWAGALPGGAAAAGKISPLLERFSNRVSL